MTLALEFRPQRFEDLVGQKHVRVILQQMVRTGNVHSSLLFSGVRGTGKTTTARIFAKALNCQASEVPRPCCECSSCTDIANGVSVSVMEIDAASNGLVDDVRKLRELVQYSVGAEWRVVLLDEAHSMSREAFNALLKVLEEPPLQTVFILLTTEPGRILETILSRCMTFDFRRISTADIVGRLQYISGVKSFSVTDALLQDIAERSSGGLRDAVMKLDQSAQVGVSTPEELRLLLGESDFAPALFRAVSVGDVVGAFELLDSVLFQCGDPSSVSSQLIGLVRDLFVLKGGGTLGCQGEALEVRRAIAAQLESDRLVAAARVLWELRTRVRTSEDRRSSLELAVVMLAEALKVPAASNGNGNGAASRKLSLAELST